MVFVDYVFKTLIRGAVIFVMGAVIFVIGAVIFVIGAGIFVIKAVIFIMGAVIFIGVGNETSGRHLSSCDAAALAW